MAFKMKGFPMQNTSALKNYNKMSDYSSKSVKFGEDEEDPAFKQKEDITEADVVSAETVEEKPKNTWDVDGDGQMNDKERVAYLKGLGLTEQEMQDEMVELAEQYGDDDYDLQDWIDAAESLSARKKQARSK
tara:strand:- start:239 stop:634 length:396 start_codon:yes stop_codon:yes gene_type:complete